MGESPGGRSSGGSLRQYVRGLNTSVTGNAQAFGFSTLITVTFGVVSSHHGPPSGVEVFGFAMAAVASFTLLNLVVAHFVEEGSDSSAGPRTRLMGTATDFIAVGAGVGVALGAQGLVDGWQAWVLTPFVASLLYVLVQGLEMAVGRQEEDGDDDR